MRTEHQSWQTILKTAAPPRTQPKEPPTPTPSYHPSTIDADALGDETQAAILQTLLSTTCPPPDLSSRLQRLAGKLEPAIDSFADGVHRIAQYRLQAERVAERILGDTSARLERREREIQKASGAGPVDGKALLGALASALGEQQQHM